MWVHLPKQKSRENSFLYGLQSFRNNLKIVHIYIYIYIYIYPFINLFFTPVNPFFSLFSNPNPTCTFNCAFLDGPYLIKSLRFSLLVYEIYFNPRELSGVLWWSSDQDLVLSLLHQGSITGLGTGIPHQATVGHGQKRNK